MASPLDNKKGVPHPCYFSHADLYAAAVLFALFPSARLAIPGPSSERPGFLAPLQCLAPPSQPRRPQPSFCLLPFLFGLSHLEDSCLVFAPDEHPVILVTGLLQLDLLFQGPSSFRSKQFCTGRFWNMVGSSQTPEEPPHQPLQGLSNQL